MPRGCERDSGKRGTVMRARMMLLALLGTAAALAAGCASGAPNVRSGMLVSTEWLAARLSDPSVVVVQVGMDRKAYDAGHVPGARFLAWNDVAVTRGVPNEIPPMPDLMVTVRRLGLDAEKKVVLYDDAGGLPAARAYVALDYVGLGDCTAMLDGHWQRWTAEGRPVTKDVPQVEPSTYAPRLRPEVVVTLRAMEDYVYAKSNIGGTPVEFIDARPPDQYAGEEPGEGIARPGHIPGAASVYWMRNIVSARDPVLKPPAELRAIYRDAGVRATDAVIAYCRTGGQAAHAYFALKYLGYDVHLYDGSYIEWQAAAGTEVTKGDRP